MIKPTNYNYASTDNNRSLHTLSTSSIASPRTLALGFNDQGKGVNKTRRGVFTGAQVVAGTTQKLQVSVSLVLPIGIETPVDDALVDAVSADVLAAMIGSHATALSKASFSDALKKVMRGQTVLPAVDDFVAPEGE